jgi:hypothetical protein
VIYLIVGLDRNTFAQWHDNVMSDDVATATEIAYARARAEGIDLVVAAIIGTYSTLIERPEHEPASESKAA